MIVSDNKHPSAHGRKLAALFLFLREVMEALVVLWVRSFMINFHSVECKMQLRGVSAGPFTSPESDMLTLFSVI